MIGTEPAPETLAVKAGALFSQFRAGDESTMAELVGLLTPILWHTARSQRLDPHSAEDVVQSAWLALVRNVEAITTPVAVLGWLIVTVRREAWRTSARLGKADPRAEQDVTVPAPAADGPEPTVVRNDTEQALWQHVGRLSARCQQLLRVIAFADRPDYAAVAAAMGMPVGSIGPTRGRCLAKLRELLDSDPAWEA